MKRFYFYCPTDSLEEFEQAAQKGAQMGATHMYISHLPKSSWQLEADPTDPYPNWGMLHTAIFKAVPMPQLAEWVPQDYVQKNWDIMLKRCEILKKYGLRAAYRGCEPGWLPEGVFAAHPDWRGARCDHPRRSRRPYYSVCIDNAEVLAMYQDAVKRLCEATEIEVFTFFTNDSGGGVCWSQGLYPGANGPRACRHISFADRMVKFMSTLQAGAAQAGMKAEIEIHGSIPEFEITATIPFLKEGQSMCGHTATGKVSTRNIGAIDNWYLDAMHPVLSIPNMMRFAQSSVDAFCDPAANCSVNLSTLKVASESRLAAYLNEAKPTTYYQVLTCLHDFAVQEVGEAHADALVEIWNLIETYHQNVHQIQEGGHVLLLGALNQRWLIRPLVPLPLELEEEVKQEYRPFQFQANSEEEAADLMDLQGARLVSGHSAATMSRNMLEQGAICIRKAHALLSGFLAQVPEAYRAEYAYVAHQMEILLCTVRNAQNCIAFQEVLDRSDFSVPRVEIPIWHVPADPLLVAMQEIMRDEIDNTYDLIGLLRQYPLQDQFIVAPTEAEQDVFAFSPRLIEQLEKKCVVMNREVQTVYNLYTRYN